MDNNKIYGGIYNSKPSSKTDKFVMDSFQLEAERDISKWYLIETLAHNLMLAEEKLVPANASRKILTELLGFIKNFDRETYIDPSIGDVHENTETKLKKLIGNEAGWVHVARSRNDQVATDQKLFLKSSLNSIFSLLTDLVEVLIKQSNNYKDDVMPGFTHLRVATPSTLGFWFQAYAVQIMDELKILKNIYDVQDKSPLGAGTSYGVNWPINTKLTSSLLGFAKPFDNSLAEINSRGINELHVLSILSSTLTILSRMMEDIVIWSMPELGLISIGEEYTTGSSIMPQKQNPDIAEKVRSKVSNTVGYLLSVLISIKGTPSGYNRDSADTKINITRAIAEFKSTIEIVTTLSSSIKPNIENMKLPIQTALATKLADELCRQYQIPFRQTHEIVGASIRKAGGNVGNISNKIIEESIGEVTNLSISLPENFVNYIFNVENSLTQYQYKGSPNPKFVMEVNEDLVNYLCQIRDWITKETNKFESSIINLITQAEKYIGQPTE